MLLPELYLEEERPWLFLIIATPTVQTIMVVKITMKAISGKTCESGTPDVKGNEANTAAARPLGNIMVMSLSYSCSSDFTAAILTTIIVCTVGVAFIKKSKGRSYSEYGSGSSIIY